MIIKFNLIEKADSWNLIRLENVEEEERAFLSSTSMTQNRHQWKNRLIKCKGYFLLLFNTKYVHMSICFKSNEIN